MGKIKSFVKNHQGLFNAIFVFSHLGEEIKSFFAPVLPRSMFAGNDSNAFHGDEQWKTLVKKITDAVSPTSIVETGTYKGDTTEYLAKISSSPIFTCEVIGMYRRESGRRLSPYKHVNLLKGSSAALIQRLVAEKKLGEMPLFFLDAHWYGYWPLADEMKHISALSKAIIMIDDFKVPGRPQFGYDVQNNDGVIIEEDINYLKPMLSGNSRVLFPKYGSAESKDIRGYIIIFQNMDSEFSKICSDPFVASNYEEYKF